MKILVTGAGGFIGHHLVKRLKAEGHFVRGADIKSPEFEVSRADEFLLLDLRDSTACNAAVSSMDHVYNLAADMGGIGYLSNSLAAVARNNALINVNMLEAAKEAAIKKFLFSSSACIYPRYAQEKIDSKPLEEAAAFPADPEPGYGWEKMFAEQLCLYYKKDFGLNVRIVRFHNVYGPLGAFEGGREKSPAALCRKIAQANAGDKLEIWGDGKQTRSFLYIDDCIEGLLRIMDSDYSLPLNLGTERLVEIDQLAALIMQIAGKRLVPVHDLTKAQGVRGRNSDNTLLRQVLGWEPLVSLEEGLSKTYEWIDQQVRFGPKATLNNSVASSAVIR
jgi:nucleoside-diphosphate-sugar epimerase